MSFFKKPSFWVSTTYFAEGFPYMLTRVISSIYFTDMGVREAFLGFLNFLGIPWNLKFLWSPFVDIFSNKRNWILKIELILTLLILGVAALVGLPQQMFGAIAFLFVGMAFVSASHDIAIDGYYMEGIPDKKEQAAYTGLRITTYRIAIVYSRTVLVGVAGVAGWTYGFGLGAITMFGCYLAHRFLLPSGAARQNNLSMTNYRQAFTSFLDQEKIWLIIPFIISYKLGDEVLFSMNTPFLMRELLVSKTQLAWLGGIVGALATVTGGIIGGLWIKKAGLKKAIWPLTLLMNVNIWAYVGLSHFRPLATSMDGLVWIAIVHGYEQCAAGLGNAALMVYLMRLCKADFKAAHFAIGSAVMSLGSTLVGGFGGVIVEAIGYTNLFIISFIASIPSMVLLLRVPLYEET